MMKTFLFLLRESIEDSAEWIFLFTLRFADTLISAFMYEENAKRERAKQRTEL